MLPLSIILGENNGIPINTVAICIMIAASSSFITPYGFQANLMILSAGNYRPADFLRYGLPLSGLVFVLTLLVFSGMGR